MDTTFERYSSALVNVIEDTSWNHVEALAQEMYKVWRDGRQLFICGNGGSAGNAIHLANDFLYGVASHVDKPGMRVEALAANSAVLTCLANDVGYEEIFAEQLRVKGQSGDLLIVLSGSGNSENVVKATNVANEMKVNTLAICGYDGGKLKQVSKNSVWIRSNDMQLCEDAQTVFGHMVMKSLCRILISI